MFISFNTFGGRRLSLRPYAIRYVVTGKFNEHPATLIAYQIDEKTLETFYVDHPHDEVVNALNQIEKAGF